MSRFDWRLEDDREPEPGCTKHRGEPADGCALCEEERPCETCGGSLLVTVDAGPYRLAWECHCNDDTRNARPEIPIAAE